MSLALSQAEWWPEFVLEVLWQEVLWQEVLWMEDSPEDICNLYGVPRYHAD